MIGTGMGVSRYFVELNSNGRQKAGDFKNVMEHTGNLFPAELSDLCDPCKFSNSIIFYIFQIEQIAPCSSSRYQYLKWKKKFLIHTGTKVFQLQEAKFPWHLILSVT